MKQNKLMLMLLMTGILALMIPTSAPFAMAKGTTTCDDVFDPIAAGSTIVGNVEIPTGADCTLDNVIVLGNVKGEKAPKSVKITNSEINGNVKLKGATGTIIITLNRIDDDKIVDSIKISESNISEFVGITKISIMLEKNLIIHGNIHLTKNKAEGSITAKNNRLEDGNIKLVVNGPMFSIQVNNNKLEDGNVQVFENIATWFRVNENDFDTDGGDDPGNLQVEDNIATGATNFGTGIEVNGNGSTNPAKIQVKNNMVMREDADMQVNNNEADGNIRVESNTVGRNFQVNGNIFFPGVENDCGVLTVNENETAEDKGGDIEVIGNGVSNNDTCNPKNIQVEKNTADKDIVVNDNEAVEKIKVKKNTARTGALSCTSNDPTAVPCN